MAKIKIFVFPILVFVLLAKPVWADPDEVAPYVSVREEYSDNIFFSNTDEKDDFITTATAGLLYTLRSERVRARLDSSLDRLFYLDNSELNDTEGRIHSRLDYSLTERTGIGASAEYQKLTRRDLDQLDTGLLTPGDRDVFNAELSSTHMFSELTQTEVRVGYGNTQLTDSNEDEDNRTIRLDLGLTRNLSKIFQNTTGLLNFSYMHYTSDNETLVTLGTSVQEYEADIFQVYAGFSRQLTELFSYYIQVGASYTESTDQTRIPFLYLGLYPAVSTSEISESNVGGVLASGLNYKGLYTEAGLSVSHDVREGAGTAGTVERSRLGLDVTRKMTENLSLTLETSFYMNVSDRENRADIDERTFNFQPGFRYRFGDNWILTGSFRFTSEDDRENDQTTERKLVYFSLRKNFEL